MKNKLLSALVIPALFCGSVAFADKVVHDQTLNGKSFAGVASYPNGDQFNVGLSFTSNFGGKMIIDGGYYSCDNNFAVVARANWTQDIKYTLVSGSAECSGSGSIKIGDDNDGRSLRAVITLHFNGDTVAYASAKLAPGTLVVTPPATASSGETTIFEIVKMDEKARNQFIVESAVAYGAERQYMGQSAMLQDQTGLNEFEYHRYLVELDGWILKGPTLWAPGSTVTARANIKGSLQQYDFDQSVYVVCVPSKFAATDFNPTKIAANLLIVYPPSFSSGSSSEPEGVNCEPADQVKADGKSVGVLKFALIKLPMDADTAERIANSGTGAAVDIDFSCIVGPGSAGSNVGWRRTNGADCTVVTGTVTAGGQVVQLQ